MFSTNSKLHCNAQSNEFELHCNAQSNEFEDSLEQNARFHCKSGLRVSKILIVNYLPR